MYHVPHTFIPHSVFCFWGGTLWTCHSFGLSPYFFYHVSTSFTFYRRARIGGCCCVVVSFVYFRRGGGFVLMFTLGAVGGLCSPFLLTTIYSFIVWFSTRNRCRGFCSCWQLSGREQRFHQTNWTNWTMFFKLQGWKVWCL